MRLAKYWQSYGSGAGSSWGYCWGLLFDTSRGFGFAVYPYSSGIQIKIGWLIITREDSTKIPQ